MRFFKKMDDEAIKVIQKVRWLKIHCHLLLKDNCNYYLCEYRHLDQTQFNGYAVVKVDFSSLADFTHSPIKESECYGEDIKVKSYRYLALI